jgi:hypothetical protein
VSLDYDELVDRVTRRTHGTRNDPLTRDEVEQVVAATLLELGRAPETADAPVLDDDDAVDDRE